ncbi:MAG: secretin N-terminal domain-containing protein [Planctomycetaceae bacterium]
MSTMLTLACILSAAPSSPQIAAAENRPERTLKAQEVKVFYLKNAEASEAARTIAALGMNKISFAVDARTNSLIATGSVNDMKMMEQVLMQLDVGNSTESTEDELRVFRLNSNAELIEEKLERLMKNRKLRTVVDEKTNSLIVSASSDAQKQVTKLLEVLDKAVAKPQASTVKLRVVWLMTGNEGTPPTDDLKPVVRSLERLGIKDLKVVTQSLVNVSEIRSAFDVSGSVGEEERTFRVSGERGDGSEGPIRLDMSIEAQPKGQKRPATIEAAVTLTPGQTAVLGVTQTRTANSAFVVQLVEGL